jgi:hypothetical protein
MDFETQLEEIQQAIDERDWEEALKQTSNLKQMLEEAQEKGNS